ncbi:MAG TPA: TatD family hydrolase [Patescibacteria group bacterium]|nr:TatD family hydrolase [Patescibacteria group bacterium]
MELVDTHCHIQSLGSSSGEKVTRSLWAKADDLTADGVIKDAVDGGVTKMICVGCSLEDSELAVGFVQSYESCYASIGIHPHESQNYVNAPDKLRQFRNLAGRDKVVAIGECGLDYYYEHSPKKDQQKILRFQLELAKEHDLPLIFHVRDAFEDFWPIFDEFDGLRGVIHSFSANIAHLNEILSRGLYVGLNGIMTFTKDKQQLEAAKAVPLDKLVLETDAPFLTPVPFRGTICQPKHVLETAKFLCHHRGETLEELSRATSTNAKELFGIK